MSETATGPLAGLEVLDLSRVLAGPWASQILGDLGATIYKIEQPGVGDDTRRWGPPFLPGSSGDAAYYACANRNKHSLAIDMAKSAGADLVRALAQRCDIVIENFRVGALSKYGLDYAALSALNPRLIYCSITGFGQDGPYKDRGGYDFLIQGMSGLMSVTGRADGQAGEGPLKVGVPICDLSTGLYAAIAILAALRHRDASGEGQHIDCALLDTQLSLLANQASNFLNGGLVPRRLGNEHPNTVPYQDFAAADGDVLVALGNDKQFRAFCAIIGRPDLPDDERFTDNARRSVNRAALQHEMAQAISARNSSELLEQMDQAGLPGGRVNSIPEIFADPHVAARGLVRQLIRTDGAPVRFVGFPAKLSRTPPNYRRAPPRSGEDTRDMLRNVLAVSETELERLASNGVIG